MRDTVGRTLNGVLTAPRLVTRVVTPILFVVALLVAGALTIPGLKPGQAQFDHHYAAVPGPLAANGPGVAATPIPAINDLTEVTIRDLSTLAQALPPEAIVGSGGTFHLLQPVLISKGALVEINGPGTLVLDHGSFLEVAPGGVLSLTDLTVRATGPTNDRGYLADVGSLMVLHHDRIIGLGRLATNTHGVSFEAATTGSGVTDCTVRDGADGIFATLSPGVRIIGNNIEFSRRDGIHIQGRTLAPVIVGNRIAESGVDGIALSSGTAGATLRTNDVLDSARYGILINATRGPLTLEHNFVTNALDGIVCDSAHAVTLRANRIENARRFGVRLSGSTRGTTVDTNVISNSTVGIYASQGPQFNLIINSDFENNQENVRIRTSAPNNVVHPFPARSELRSP